MRVVSPYKLDKEHSNDKLILNINYDDRMVYLSFINNRLKYTNEQIKKFSLSSDIEKTLYSKEKKYRRYRKLLSETRQLLEESLLDEYDEIEFTYEIYSIFYASIMCEYEKLLFNIDKWGYDIIDTEMANKIQTILKNKDELNEMINKVDNALFPEYENMLDELEEKYWIIDNDDAFPSQEEINEEEKTIQIFIHEYEIEYLIEYLIVFRDLIEKKPNDKIFDTLKLYVEENKYIYINKKLQLTFIDSVIKSLEKWTPGDRVIAISPSEYILFSLLIKGFYFKMNKKYEDYHLSLSDIELNFVITSFIQTRLFLPYNKPIEGYKEPIFNRYFYDK
jgi:hypothetical protein